MLVRVEFRSQARWHRVIAWLIGRRGTATEIEDKKIVGDGSAQRVDLNTTPSKYMSVKVRARRE